MPASSISPGISAPKDPRTPEQIKDHPLDCYHNDEKGKGGCKDADCWMQPGGSHFPCDCHPELHMETCAGAGKDWSDGPIVDLAEGIPKAIVLPAGGSGFMVAKFDMFGMALRNLHPRSRVKGCQVETFVPISTHRTYAAAVRAATKFLKAGSLDTDERRAFDAARVAEGSRELCRA